MTSDKVFNQDEKLKLTQIINEGMTVMQEVEDLTAGLNETVKAIAEEMDMKPALLNKAIRIAYKNEFAQTQENFSQVEEILAAVGRDN